MENPENVLMELTGFEKAPLPAIPKTLEDYLLFVAKTGNTVFPWNKIKPLVKSKLEIIIREFNESCPAENLPKMPNVDAFKFGEMKERILEQLDSYTGTPFTIQRLCELLVQPKRHYKRTDKFMRGLEKVMLVVSTVDPVCNSSAQETSGTMLVEREKLKVGACSQVYESPSKRIRLASAEEEGGPCDSADGVSPSGSKVSEDMPDLCPSAGPSSLPSVSTPSPSSANTSPTSPSAGPEAASESEMDSMDIDTECTSSVARLSLPDREGSVESTNEQSEEEAESSPEENVESSQETERREASPEGEDWVMVEKPAPAVSVCDTGLVSTSATGDEGSGSADNVEQEGVSDSTEGEVGGSDSTEMESGVSDSTEGAREVSDSTDRDREVSDSSREAADGTSVSDSEATAESSDMDQEGVADSEVEPDKSDTCSSSDQGEGTSVDQGEEETNREAEPAEEREEVVAGEGDSDSSPVSVQSSEERLDSLPDEPRGAADSSDEISATVAAAPFPAAEVTEQEDTSADQPSCSEGEADIVTDTPEEDRGGQVEEGNSPDQSDTAQ